MRKRKKTLTIAVDYSIFISKLRAIVTLDFHPQYQE